MRAPLAISGRVLLAPVVVLRAGVGADPQAVDPLAGLVGPVGAGEAATPVGGLLTSSRSCT